MSTNGSLQYLRWLFGQAAVFIPIPLGEKAPKIPGWQNTTVAQMQGAFMHRLVSACAAGGNIGVLQTGGLVSIDIDDDALVEPFLELNPALRKATRTRGARGVQIHLRMIGAEFPTSVQKIKTRAGATWGEFRGGQSQSVIYGKHPTGDHYQIVVDKPVSEIDFASINWPSDLVLPWAKQDQTRTASIPRSGGELSADLDKRILAYLDAIPAAISGQDGHSQTFKASIALVKGFDLSTDEALHYLAIYNQHCEPQWSEKELKHKISDAEKAPDTKPRGYLIARSSVPGRTATDRDEPPFTHRRGEAGRLSEEVSPQKQSWPDVEGEIAASLRAALGQVRCVGDEWFVCNDGVWYPRNRDEFRPRALELLPKQFKTHRNTIETLKRLESEQQVTHSGFFGAAKFNAEGFPLISVQNGTLCITPNGVLSLATAPDCGFTMALPVAYEPSARSPLFNRVLREAVPEEADRELFLDVISTALIPDCRFEVGLVVIGEAATGKSTCMAPIPSIFGSACSSLSMSDLCHPNGYKLSLLRHVMINLATELNTLELDDSGLFKQLISGEQFTARPIYGRPFERSTAKLVFLANSLPRFKSGTDAEVRRLRFVRFDRKVSNPDVTLKEAVALEAPGLFAELVRRASELLAGRKLSEPSQWGTNTADRFSVSNDPVGQFVRRFCQLGPSLSCDKDILIEEFRKFRDGHGISDRFDDVAFFRTLYDRFPAVQQRKIRSEVGRKRVISGINLIDDE